MTGEERLWEYVKDIESNNIVSNIHIKNAIKRFRKDLERQGTEDFPYIWKPELGERFIKFAELLKQVNDKWAGQPLKLMNWQCFCLMNVYSWVHRDTGLRRFRKALIIVSRKCGKSTMIATTGLWDILSEAGSQVCIAATTRQQAKIVFGVISAMVDQNEILTKRLKQYKSTSTIVNASNYGKIEALSSESKKSGDGKNCSLGIFDEVAVSSWDIYKIIESGQGSRPAPLNFMISSCSSQLDSMGYDEWVRCSKILQGVIEDDSTFAMLYGIDEQDDWRDESVWEKAIPSLNQTVNLEFVRKLKLQAEQQLSLQQEFINKIMCRWTSNEFAWIPDSKWTRCMKDDKPDLNKPYYANISLDLSRRNDLTSLTLCVYQEGKYYFRHWLYFPKDSLQDRIKQETQLWQNWFDKGIVTALPGEVIDYSYVASQIEKICSEYVIEECLYDPYNSNKLIVDLENSLTMIPINQTLKQMSPYTKVYEEHLLKGNIIDPNPFMRWAISNAKIYIDPNENYKVIKNERKGRDTHNLHIDPVITSIMCCGRIQSLLDVGEIDLRTKEQVAEDTKNFLSKLSF